MRIFKSMLVVILAFSLILTFSVATVSSAAEFTFTHGTHTSAGSLIGEAGQKFNDYVEELTGDRIKMNFYPGGQFGGAVAHIEQMQAGAIDFNTDVVEWYGRWNKDFNIFGWGFAFEDDEHFQRFINSERFNTMKEEMQENNNVRILNVVPTEPRIFFSRNPIEGVEDLQGITMRVPEIEAYLKVWEGLGTNPAQIPWGDLYTSLRTGVVDAAEGPLTLSYEDRLHEGGSYVYLTNHIINSVSFAMSEDKFQSLPDDLKEKVEEAAILAGEWAMERSAVMVEEFIERYKEDGANVSELDVEEFQNKLLEIVQEVEDDGLWNQGLFMEVQEVQ